MLRFVLRIRADVHARCDFLWKTSTRTNCGARLRALHFGNFHHHSTMLARLHSDPFISHILIVISIAIKSRLAHLYAPYVQAAATRNSVHTFASNVNNYVSSLEPPNPQNNDKSSNQPHVQAACFQHLPRSLKHTIRKPLNNNNLRTL
jgi:hypothetical protein